jgi:hypothetical protein
MLYPMKRYTSGHRIWVTIIAGSILLAGASIAALAADSPLVGARQLDSAQTGQAGIYLFTSSHYMMWAAIDRPDIADTSKATADELRAIWGPMVANAGKYQVSGNLITIHPVVAKIPVVIKAGANEVYQFRMEGKTLTLRQV